MWAISAIAYAGHLVVSISLVHHYILPVAVSVILPPEAISHSVIVIGGLVRDDYPPRRSSSSITLTAHKLSAARLVFLMMSPYFFVKPDFDRSAKMTG